jgi:hypothetical protein
MGIDARDFAGLLREDVESSMFEGYDQQVSIIPQVMEVVPFTAAPKKMQGALRRPGGDIKELSAREVRRIPFAWKFIAEKIRIPDEIKMFLDQSPNGQVSDRLADDVRDLVKPQAVLLGKERARREEELAAGFFNNGGLTAGTPEMDQSIEIFQDAQGDLAYDGIEPFNLTGNARSAVDGTTYFNASALALSTTNLDTQLQLMESTNAFDEMGRTIHLRAGQLIIPPALKQTAVQIVAARALAGTGNNDANPYADLDLVVWNHLTDTDAWFLQDPTRKAFRWYDGGPPMVKVLEAENFSSVIEVQWKYACNMTDWRGIVASQVASS